MAKIKEIAVLEGLIKAWEERADWVTIANLTLSSITSDPSPPQRGAEMK